MDSLPRVSEYSSTMNRSNVNIRASRTGLVCLMLAQACTGSTPKAVPSSTSFSVLVYGSTPSGILAAVAAARHLPNGTDAGAGSHRVGLLSQRQHIGGVCSGGLGQTDIGSCADEVIGGLAHEFFLRNAKKYRTPQPRAPWNRESHASELIAAHWPYLL